ncbi:MAG: hypothetical protein FWD19_02170, partial [Defluviitaleaceae bacterium]|nr:hypothetical protein [Defluviitaleaceae bacterium]
MRKFFFLFVIIFSTRVFGAPANPAPIDFAQPDGTIVRVYTKGDEFLGWLEDENGFLVAFDAAQRAITYADWTENGAVSTGKIAGDIFAMSEREKTEVPPKLIAQAESEREESSSATFGNENLRRELLIIHATWQNRTEIADAFGNLMPTVSAQNIFELV